MVVVVVVVMFEVVGLVVVVGLVGSSAWCTMVYSGFLCVHTHILPRVQ